MRTAPQRDPHLAFCDAAAQAPLRLLIVADRYGATQEISFVHPLAPWRVVGAAAIRVVDEPGLERIRAASGDEGVRNFLDRQMKEFQPTAVIISRYNGMDYARVLKRARAHGVPVAYHLDDDLFEVPIAVGIDVFQRYRQPSRVHATYRIAEQADVVYISTPALGHRVKSRLSPRRLIVSDIYVGGDEAALPSRPADKPAGEVRIGYMASAGHAFDLELIAPALISVLRDRPNTRLHFFGTICSSDVVGEFGDNCVRTGRIRGGYAEFRQTLGRLGWDIGLAPLRDNDFNRCKAPTKWVEYVEAGMAVIASDMPVYEPLARKGALEACPDTEWAARLCALIDDPQSRLRLSQTGRQVMAREFGWRRVEDQVIDLLAALNPAIVASLGAMAS